MSSRTGRTQPGFATASSPRARLRARAAGCLSKQKGVGASGVGRLGAARIPRELEPNGHPICMCRRRGTRRHGGRGATRREHPDARSRSRLDRSNTGGFSFSLRPTAPSPRSPPPCLPSPGVAHTSGACTLDALDPHRRRFSLHPLQTFTLDRGPEQLDRAWARSPSRPSRPGRRFLRSPACSGSEPPRCRGRRTPSSSHGRRDRRSGFLATLHEVAAELFLAAGALPEALEP